MLIESGRALRIGRELAAKDGTLLQFTLNGGEPENTENISLHTLDRKMAKFRDHQLTAAELSEYITSLVPPLIRQRLQALDRRRLFLGIITERDLNAEHPLSLSRYSLGSRVCVWEGGRDLGDGL